ncbi:hypothetical protein Aduo_001187 [Ancylostoma duodenale]
METPDGAPPGLPPPGLSPSSQDASTGEFSNNLSTSRDPAVTQNNLAPEPRRQPTTADESSASTTDEVSSPLRMDDADMPADQNERTRDLSETNYDVVDMDTSSPPLTPTSRDPADTLTCSTQDHLDLSEEVLLASPRSQQDELTLTSSLESLAVTMPMTATVLAGLDKSILRREKEARAERIAEFRSRSSPADSPPKRAAGKFDVEEFPPLSGFSSPPPGPSQPWPAVSAPDEGDLPEYHQGSSSQGNGSGHVQRGGRNTGRGRGSGRGRGRSNSRATGHDYSYQRWGALESDAVFEGGPLSMPSQTPRSFFHYLMTSHPWGDLVNPRPIRFLRKDTARVITRMPTDVYEHPPASGYMKLSYSLYQKLYNRTLFPNVPLSNHMPPESVPLIEMQHLEDTIAFRQRSYEVLRRALDRDYAEPTPLTFLEYQTAYTTPS